MGAGLPLNRLVGGKHFEIGSKKGEPQRQSLSQAAQSWDMEGENLKARQPNQASTSILL